MSWVPVVTLHSTIVAVCFLLRWSIHRLWHATGHQAVTTACDQTCTYWTKGHGPCANNLQIPRSLEPGYSNRLYARRSWHPSEANIKEARSHVSLADYAKTTRAKNTNKRTHKHTKSQKQHERTRTPAHGHGHKHGQSHRDTRLQRHTHTHTCPRRLQTTNQTPTSATRHTPAGTESLSGRPNALSNQNATRKQSEHYYQINTKPKRNQ